MSEKGKGITAGDASSEAEGRPGVPQASADAAIVEALRRGDEEAFTRLVDQHHEVLRRIARLYVSSPAVADEVVQDTWLAVIQGLWAFEGRSSLKTWILRILINRSKTRAQREGRTVPFSEVWAGEPEPAEITMGAPHRDAASDGLNPGVHHAAMDNPTAARHRNISLQDPGLSPEARLLTQETRAALRVAIDALPPNQRLVITMRDIEGCSSEEVCNSLGLSETNQRVILHRARSNIRARLTVQFRKE